MYTALPCKVQITEGATGFPVYILKVKLALFVMGQGVGTLPAANITVKCEDKVTTDVIQRQVKACETSSDADLLRAASNWVSDQYSWVLSDLQLAVYGKDSWVFHAGGRATQVVFNANSDKINEPAWERRGWKVSIYNGFKMALKLVAAVFPIAAPVAEAIPALGTTAGNVMGAAGAAADALSKKM
ncbi:uncharacterized protein LOC144927155 [Branchiostoma floridae x Branchiostoma belcheri]